MSLRSFSGLQFIIFQKLNIYSPGVDPLIVHVKHVGLEGREVKKERWIKSYTRNIHTHDIRAMALTSSDKIFSGGKLRNTATFPLLCLYSCLLSSVPQW